MPTATGKNAYKTKDRAATIMLAVFLQHANAKAWLCIKIFRLNWFGLH